jgi:hypothetical protein
VINFLGSSESPETGNKIGIPATGISFEIRIVFCQHRNNDDTIYTTLESLDECSDKIVLKQIFGITKIFGVHLFNSQLRIASETVKRYGLIVFQIY